MAVTIHIEASHVQVWIYGTSGTKELTPDDAGCESFNGIYGVIRCSDSRPLAPQDPPVIGGRIRPGGRS
jgi:hypothetical protein